MIARLLATGVTVFARLVTGVRGNWSGCLPDPRPRLYFANHRSHGDFVLIWTVLPAVLRRQTRPVAAADYWTRGRLRRFIAERVFNALLIDRRAADREADPVDLLRQALDAGSSLIFFPEGTRNIGDEPLLPLKSGIYRLARSRPDVELVPTWIDNLNRVLPKGEFVPVPLLCTVSFGTPIAVAEGDDSTSFRARCRAAMLELAPDEASE